MPIYTAFQNQENFLILNKSATDLPAQKWGKKICMTFYWPVHERKIILT